MVRLSLIAAMLGLMAGCGSNAGPISNLFDSGNPTVDVPVTTDVPVAMDTSTTVDIPATDVQVATDSGATCGGTLGPCNPVTNSGCTAGMGCYIYQTSATSAPMAMCMQAGTMGTGATCTSVNDCLTGFACLGSPGQCQKLCCGDDNTSCRDLSHGGSLGALCDLSLMGIDINVCGATMACNEYATTGNGCPTAMPLCLVVAMDGSTSCSPENTGAGGEGHPCCDLADCTAGYLCLASSSGTCNPSSPNGMCQRVCDPTAGADAGASPCPSGQTCGGLTDSPTNYGACSAPMM